MIRDCRLRAVPLDLLSPLEVSAISSSRPVRPDIFFRFLEELVHVGTQISDRGKRQSLTLFSSTAPRRTFMARSPSTHCAPVCRHLKSVSLALAPLNEEHPCEIEPAGSHL